MMTTNRVQHKTLRDVSHFETRMARFQSGINATLPNCVKNDIFEQRMWELNERISRLERKHDAETKALVARCDRLERELTAMRETPKQGETNGKEAVQRPPPQDTALQRAFSEKDLEVMENGINALKEWTDKARATVIYDSKIDPFTANGLFNNVSGKPNIALVGFTTDGDVFGGFYSVAVTDRSKQFFDPNIFAFSFESHGRCETPQRFVLREGLKKQAEVSFGMSNSWFVWFGVNNVGNFSLGNERSDLICWNLSNGFEGIKDTTLTGQNNSNWKGPFHHCCRLVAVHLSN